MQVHRRALVRSCFPSNVDRSVAASRSVIAAGERAVEGGENRPRRAR
jgi:hypothetical protein